MAFYLGEDVTVYLSTDHTGSGVSMSAADGVISAVAWVTDSSLIADYVAPPLAGTAWDGTEADATGSGPARGRIIGEVAGVDDSLDKEIEDLELLGRITIDRITIRKKGEISVTRLASSAEFGKIYEDADLGVSGDATLHDGRSQNLTNSGYRIYIQLSPSTGSDNMWITGRGMKISNHVVNITPSRTVQEVITFMGELWDIDTQPFITVTTTAEL